MTRDMQNFEKPVLEQFFLRLGRLRNEGTRKDLVE